MVFNIFSAIFFPEEEEKETVGIEKESERIEIEEDIIEVRTTSIPIQFFRSDNINRFTLLLFSFF